MFIKTDSRKIQPGDIFVALRGNNDGHQYIQDAITKGASKIIAEEGTYEVETEIVKDTREYLSKYLKEKYYPEIKDIKLIGITGTNGKTTSAFLLYQALNKLNIKSAYIGTIGFHFNSEIKELQNTTPDLLEIYEMLLEAKDAKYVIMEVSSHALAQQRVLGLEFDYAIFTNLTQDHLDYHKTMENYMNSKKKLFSQLTKKGKSIINIDDSNGLFFTQKESITFGIKNATYNIDNIILDDEVTKFKINKKEYQTQLLGKHNVYNLIPTIIILEDLGIKNIEETVKEIKAPKGRMEIVKHNTNKIIIDYAHTPDAVEKILESINSFKKGKVYTIIGCGGNRDKTKRPIMAKTATKLSNYCIFTSDNPREEDPEEIINDMISNIDNDNYEIEINREKAIDKAIQKLVKNDILLVLGKGHEPYQIIGKEKLPFDDKEIVLKYI